MHEQATKFIDYLDTLTAVPGELRRGPTALDGMDLAQHRAPGHCFERGPSADLLIVAQQNIAASSVRFDLGFGWREHFCASPTAVHVIPADADARWRLDGESQCVFLALSDRQAKSLLEELRVPQPADCLWTLASRGFDDAYVHEMVLQLWREVTTLGPNPLLASSCRVALLHALGRRFQRGGRDARAVPKLGQAALARVLAAMHELPASGLSVEGLAQLAGLSPFHFSRLFRNSTGRSPYRYYEEFRIGRARALLADSRLSIADIGRLLGYADPGQFSRAFRRHVGCPPRAYRRECVR